MPYKDPQKRRDRQKLYRQTPRGMEVAQRSKDKFYAKRRAQHDDTPMTIEPTALANAIGTWPVVKDDE